MTEEQEPTRIVEKFLKFVLSEDPIKKERFKEAWNFSIESALYDTNVKKHIENGNITEDDHIINTYVNLYVNEHNKGKFQAGDSGKTMEARINAVLPFAFKEAAETLGITAERVAQSYHKVVEHTVTTYDS
ncbi:MAG: hypothetical protein GY861_06820 [bacterium]|nr:hypothetical protein [bacterium]